MSPCKSFGNFFLGLVLAVVFFQCPARAELPEISVFNPAPAENDLVISGPDGLEFVFRPVYVSGESVFGGTAFIMGNPEGHEFRAPPTRVVVGGSFEGDAENGDWLFYMGKYEVTEAQYALIMGGEPASGSESGLPVTNITYYDAMAFCEKLNIWIYENALAQMPTSGPFPGFIRLPLEAEWEYAARGGSKVSPVDFEASIPYPDYDLLPYEWFSGPESSHNKVQAVGELEANALGLHDMLGNVQEMMQNSYQIEYYQGRSGGFATRGGHYLTDEGNMNVSMRSEEPFFLGSAERGMRPNAKPTLGLRLVLSAPLLTDREAIAAFSDAWDDYRQGSGAQMPAAQSVAPVSEQESVSARDALARLDLLRAQLTDGNSAPAAIQELAYIETALRNMSKVREQADADSARVWVRIAAERGMFLANNLERMQITAEQLASGASSEEMRQLLQERLEQYSYNVESGIEDYREIMVELGKLPESAVAGAFTDHRDVLGARMREAGGMAEQQKDLERQIEKLSITMSHWARYHQEKQSDATAWRTDYTTPTESGLE